MKHSLFFPVSHTFWPRSDNSTVSALLGIDLISSSSFSLSLSLWSGDPAPDLCVSQTQAFDLSPRGLLFQSPLQEAPCRAYMRVGCACSLTRLLWSPGGGAKDCPCIKTAACFMVGCGIKMDSWRAQTENAFPYFRWKN